MNIEDKFNKLLAELKETHYNGTLADAKRILDSKKLYLFVQENEANLLTSEDKEVRTLVQLYKNLGLIQEAETDEVL